MGTTADDHRNDPTVHRCAGFARAWGYGGIECCSLYGLVATDPTTLWEHTDPIGPDNDAHLAAMAAQRDLIALGWGADVDTDRAAEVARMLRGAAARHGGALAVLGWTPQGQPCHPLGVPPATLPECFTPQSGRGAAAWDAHASAVDRRWALLIGSVA